MGAMTGGRQDRLDMRSYIGIHGVRPLPGLMIAVLLLGTADSITGP